MTSFNLCSSGQIIQKAGAKASASAIASNAILSSFCDQAEATFCTKTRYDWVANKTSVGTNFLQCIADAVSDLAALKVVAYDMSGYTTKREAETLLDFLTNNSDRIIADLRNEEFKEILI